jgi:integrase
LWVDRIDSYRSEQELEEKSIEFSIQRFIRHHQDRAKLGKISVGRASNIKRDIEAFRDQVGGSRGIETIGEASLRAYYHHVQQQIVDGKFGTSAGRDRATCADQFVRWLWREGIIESLPRNLGAHEVSVASREVQVFEKPEIKNLWSFADERMKLFILLALNCGMTQKDISDLKPEEVNWHSGQIKRKRSKTKGKASTPTVTYTLWPETFRLLKKFRSTSKTYVLLNQNGTQFKSEKFNASGNQNKIDLIGKKFLELKKECGIEGRSFINLKKTSRSLLEDNKEFYAIAELFVGRSPRTVSEKHYAKPAVGWLAEATDWLREELQIESLDTHHREKAKSKSLQKR